MAAVELHPNREQRIMSLTPKEKELAAVGASLAAGCKSCADFHFQQVKQAGASDEEIEQAISDAIAVRDSAGGIMERYGLKLLGLTPKGVADDDGADSTEGTTRVRELVRIAAAAALSCTSSLEKHMALARCLDVTDVEIRSVVASARFIKGKADSICCKHI
jgi:AhpD family alkylhydroperoxidase